MISIQHIPILFLLYINVILFYYIIKMKAFTLLLPNLLLLTSASPSNFDHLEKLADYQKDSMASLFNPDLFLEKWQSMLSLFSNDEQQQKKQWARHEKTGVFRSSEGTADEIRQRLRLQEERQRLQELMEAGGYSEDHRQNKEMYQLHHELKVKALHQENQDMNPLSPDFLSLQSFDGDT